MSNLRTAAQQALEALETYRQMMFAEAGCRWDGGDAAITALRAALAQQAEPRNQCGETCERAKLCATCAQALAQQAEGGGNLPPPLQAEPVAAVAENATTQQRVAETPPSDYSRGYWDGFNIGKREGRIEAEDALAQRAEPEPLPPEQRQRWEELAAMPQQDEPAQAPEEFDHGVGADRFKVVRGAFWWHILIGDSPTRRGKFRSPAAAEEMVGLLLREFRNGAFVQHSTHPPQRPPLTDEEIDKATAQERDALLDHIYEYGTAAEGVLERIRKLCRAIERKVREEA